MDVLAVIPARYGSTRFPGKPLARDTGRYLIQHVCERVGAARRIDRCIVATDDERILTAVSSFGGEARMTNPDHLSGTDRIAEVVRSLGGGAEPDIVLNVQGDEPEVEPGHLDLLVSRMADDPACQTGTLACPFPDDVDPRDPNCVKVVCDRRGRALYFSRSLIPYGRDQGGEITPRDWLLHLGVYAFRREFLLELTGWPASPLEGIEKLEQLRVLENGCAMAVEVVPRAASGIDTPEEYRRFVERWNARCSAGAVTPKRQREPMNPQSDRSTR